MKRTLARQVKVFPAEGGFRVIRMETSENAERLVLREVLRPVFDQVTGALLGYRVDGAEAQKVDADVKSIRSTITISPAEMELNCQRSRTYGLREEQRREREANGLEPEDRVERVRAKVRVYARIGSGKGDILRVWPR